MKNRGKTESLLALLLLGLFAVCILLVLLSGTEIYRGLTERSRTGYESRTAAQYLATRLRQGDAALSVRLADFGGADALVLTQNVDGILYETRVYCSGGYLRELFIREGTPCAPEDGEAILPLKSMDMTMSGGLLQAELLFSDNSTQRITLAIRSKGGGLS
jgi:hypothetical protein